MIEDYLELLEEVFIENSNPKIAKEQSAYLRNQFEFYGLKTPLRREIQKPFLQKVNLPPKAMVYELTKTLWNKPQREYHYFGQELAFKYQKRMEENDLNLYTYMIVTNSWWDTVDFIATKLVSAYFKKYPESIQSKVKEWISSDNIWLQRTSIIYQLKWKDELDKDILKSAILSLYDTNEFFINKAIGWVLREYSRTNPDWVVNIADTVDLHSLSRREALRLIKTAN